MGLDILSSLFMLLIGFAVLLFPGGMIAFRERHRFVYRVLFVVAVAIQLPLLIVGYLILGLSHVGHHLMSKIIEVTYGMSPVLYIVIFFLSVGIQAWKKVEGGSFSVALLSSFLLIPLLIFHVLYFLGNIAFFHNLGR